MSAIGKIERFVENQFPSFGINKKREFVRLIFEIAKREGLSYGKITEIISKAGYRNYREVKNFLVNWRYPHYKNGEGLRLYLPELKIDYRYKFNLRSEFNFSPRNVYVEERAKNSYLVRRFRELFPQARVFLINSLKEYVQGKEFSLIDYNRRKDNVFIVSENYDFFKKCPCSKNAISCGYRILNLGSGCIYECVYCYLQIYLKNAPGIILPFNLDDFFKNLPEKPLNSSIFCRVRLGNGEFSDSLALDDITQWSFQLVSFFRKKPDFLFEFKTKSKNIDNLISIKAEENIIISWSLNPQVIIDSLEFYTASLKERISSAKICAEHGYKVGFHFDPIVYYKNWEDDYHELVNLVFKNIAVKKIAWISLGTLRFNPELKKIIENRFPDNKILDEELFIDFDNKLRYHPQLRIIIYKKMYSWIRKWGRGIPVYLCMEHKDIWKEVYGS